MRNKLGCVALFASCALGQMQLRPLPAPNAMTKPAMLKSVGIDQKLNAQLPLELTFKDETGQTVPLGQYFRDKPVILALVYYECPMLCNMTLNGLTHSLQ